MTSTHILQKLKLSEVVEENCGLRNRGSHKGKNHSSACADGCHMGIGSMLLNLPILHVSKAGNLDLLVKSPDF